MESWEKRSNIFKGISNFALTNRFHPSFHASIICVCDLQRKNTLLSHDIHNEREAIVELKVKIKLLQEAGPRILADLSKADLGGDPVDHNQSLQTWLDKESDSTDSSVFDGGTHGAQRKQKAETLPKMSRPMYGEYSLDGSPGILKRETSL